MKDIWKKKVPAWVMLVAIATLIILVMSFFIVVERPHAL